MCSGIGRAQSSSLFANDSLSDPAKNEILVPPKTTIAIRLAVTKQEFNRTERQPANDGHSLAVDGPKRTAATWGITGPELDRLCNAVWFMGRHCNPSRADLWWASTVGATKRDVIADIWKRITRLQGSHGIRQYSVVTFESRGGVHAHIMFLGTRDIAKRVKQSARFGELLDIDPVTDPVGLTRRYLAKERTSQAGYRREHTLGGRLKGSHRLPGGGDRVRLSRELERDAIEAGYDSTWQHTNAKRSVEEKPHKVRRCSSGGERHPPTGRR
jgi:hypothetical protein